jgi:KDO2-lipid IV(A) lauroyltransferase
VAGDSALSSARGSLALVAYQAASAIVPRLPGRLAYGLAIMMGDLAWMLGRRARRAVYSNLGRVLGRPPTWRMVRRVFEHAARNYVDTFLIPTLSGSEIERLVPIGGWEHLEHARRAGRGAIIVAAHLSSVGLAGQVIAARGIPIVCVVEQVEPPGLLALLSRLRGGAGVRIVPLGPELVKQLLVMLKRNEVVGLIMDRDVAGTGVSVDFFGAPCKLPGGAALLALRTGAPILPACAYRGARQELRARIERPVEVSRGANLRESVQLTTRRIAERLERMIASHPEQWTLLESPWAAQEPQAWQAQPV